jgi:peptidoglycan-N-acetylglucosamine deacetylase
VIAVEEKALAENRRHGETQRAVAKTTLVTTSWDDGNRADLRVAELLAERGVTGTFYIPIHYEERTLENRELRDLAVQGFEIGGHGFSHKLLWGLSPKELSDEIAPCKPMLEDIVGKPVEMFCYPCGRYDANVVRALQQAGYRGARTTRMLATRPDFSPFAIPTTVQIFPHPPLTYLKNVVRAGRMEGLKAYMTQQPRLGSWLELGKRLFDSVLQNGGVWHLYGHSWEIDRLGLWDDLGELLDYVSRREGVHYVPNCELVPASGNGRH